MQHQNSRQKLENTSIASKKKIHETIITTNAGETYTSATATMGPELDTNHAGEIQHQNRELKEQNTS
jgi:hypothetical protein